MFRFRRLFWLSVFVGVGYMIWRWAQRQGEAVTPADTARLYTPPATPAVPAPATATSDAPAAPTGRRPIPTRVHRGAPPPARPSAAEEQPPPAAAPAPEPATAEPAPEAPAPEPAAAELAPEAVVADLATEPAPEPAAAEPAPELVPEAAVADLAPEAAVAAPDADAPLTNINTADEDALVALPGIGRALAKRIIAHRQEHGPFANIDDLEVIQGIGSRNIAEFRHLVTV